MNPDTHILLVDDDDNDVVVMCHALKAQGITAPIHICRTGAEAIQYLAGEGPFADRARYPYPAMIFTDLKMPLMNGFDFLQWLKAHSDLMVIPVIVWSGSAEEDDVKHAYCLGAHGFIRKPGPIADLRKIVGDTLEYWANCSIPAIGGKTCAEAAHRPDKF